MVLEKDREDQLGRLCGKRGNITWSKVGEEYPTYKKKGRKGDWMTGLATFCLGTAC